MSDTTNAIIANTKFTEENIPGLVDEICELIAVGYGLKQALEQKQAFPSYNTFYKWLDQYEYVRDKYARARELQQDYESDNMVDIADDSGLDARIVDGKVVVDGENINRARLRIDARKWRASKLAPKKYGDRLDLNHSGTVQLSEAAADAKLVVLLRKAGIGGVAGSEGTGDSADAAQSLQAVPQAD